MSARARRLTVLLAVLLAIGTPLAVAAATGPSGPTYRVQSGDTITSIAVQLRLPGGWQQLYSANRDRIGDDPNRLEVGTELSVPQGAAVPAGQGYVVRPGDTLNSIASRLQIPGGGDALYAANRSVIGPNPNRLEVGQTLLPPGAALPRPVAPSAPASTAPDAQAPSGADSQPQVPLAQAQTAPAADSGGSSAVWWTAIGAMLFVLLVVLVLFVMPRWRRSRGDEIWVGGEYTEARRSGYPLAAASTRAEPAVTDPEPPATPAEAPQPSGHQANGHQPNGHASNGSLIAAFRPGSLGRPSRQRRETVDSSAMSAPSAAPLRAAPSRPAAPARGDLADELFGEVRLVDPSTPLTKDRRSQG